MARRQGAPLALRALTLLFLAGCAKPYEPACRADAPTRLGEPTFELQLRAGGEVTAGRSRLLDGDAGAGREVTVHVHAWDGTLRREVSGTFEQPGDDSFGLRSSFGTERDGELWRLRIRGQPDGGQSAVWLERSDAGAPLPGSDCDGCRFVAPRLTPVGTRLIASVQRFGGTSLAWSLDGFDAGAPVVLAENETPTHGGDALVLSPGPTARDAALRPRFAAPREPPNAFPIADVSLDAERLDLAWCDLEQQLFVQRFDAQGSALAPAARLSSCALALAVHSSVRATAVVFDDQGPSGAVRFNRWLAVLDAAGVKRGPDVPLPMASDPVGTPVIAESAEGYGVFAPLVSGLHHWVVRCE